MTTKQPEVVVVGASLAGAQAALRLAGAGIATRVLESRTAPHAKVCGEGLHPAGRILLSEVLGDVSHLGVPLHGFAFSDAVPLLQMDHSEGEVGLGCDRLLLERALWERLEAHGGIDFRRAVTVRGLTQASGGFRVVADEVVDAKFVVAADGVRSRCRAWAGRERSSRYGRWGLRQRFAVDRPPDRVHIGFLGDGEVFVTPLPGGRISVAILGSETMARATRSVADLGDLVPELDLGRLEPLDAPQLLPHCGSDARQLYRDGLFLAGDAGAFLDPISGAGMTLASVSARVIADAVQRSRCEPAAAARIERDAERRFRRALRPYRQLTWFLRALSRSAALRRTTVAVLSRTPRALALLSRPTTAAWTERTIGPVAAPSS